MKPDETRILTSEQTLNHCILRIGEVKNLLFKYLVNVILELYRLRAS